MRRVLMLALIAAPARLAAQNFDVMEATIATVHAGFASG